MRVSTPLRWLVVAALVATAVGCVSKQYGLALSTEINLAFRSRVPLTSVSVHQDALRDLSQKLRDSGFSMRDPKTLVKKFGLDDTRSAKLPPPSAEIYLARDRDGELAPIVHLARYEGRESLLSATVIWFASGATIEGSQAKADKLRDDLQVWWALNGPSE